MPEQAVLTARNVGFDVMLETLRHQQARKLDVVAPSTAIRMNNAKLVVKGIDAVVKDEGVTSVDGTYVPTEVFWDGVTDRLHIPRRFLRNLYTSRPDLLDKLVNGLLLGLYDYGWPSPDYITPKPEPVEIYPADPRSHLLRLFRGDHDEDGLARAMLSDSYRLTMDHLDVLTGVLRGIEEAGLKPDNLILTGNLSDRHMRLRVEAPEVSLLCPGLLDGYRSPFTRTQFRRAGSRVGYNTSGGKPIIWSGFDLENSETGDGAYTLTPVLGVEVCGNGLVLPHYSERRIHLGARLAAGVVKISAETIRKALDLITSETTDLVSTWLSPDFLAMAVGELEERSGKVLVNIQATVQTVASSLSFTEEEQASVFDHFLAGGQLTSGGVMQAVSSLAQTIEDPDRSYAVEQQAVRAMDLAVALTS